MPAIFTETGRVSSLSLKERKIAEFLFSNFTLFTHHGRIVWQDITRKGVGHDSQREASFHLSWKFFLLHLFLYSSTLYMFYYYILILNFLAGSRQV